MAYIKFLGAEDVRKADVLPMTLHTVRITGEIEPNTGGFRLYLDEKCLYPLDNGEYESYTTLYREGEGWFELSDDESVYTSPDAEEDSGIAEPVPITLDAVRTAKLREVSAACERVIYAGVDVILPGGTQEHFSLTEKDQINLQILQPGGNAGDYYSGHAACILPRYLLQLPEYVDQGCWNCRGNKCHILWGGNSGSISE